MNSILKNKRGQMGGNIISNVLVTLGSLVITTIIILVIVSQVRDANLLTANSAEANATAQMAGNLTSGLANINNKIPTFLIVVGVVFLLGILGYLWYWLGGKKGPM